MLTAEMLSELVIRLVVIVNAAWVLVLLIVALVLRKPLSEVANAMKANNDNPNFTNTLDKAFQQSNAQTQLLIRTVGGFVDLFSKLVTAIPGINQVPGLVDTLNEGDRFFEKITDGVIEPEPAPSPDPVTTTITTPAPAPESPPEDAEPVG